jgi:hypothetical protein
MSEDASFQSFIKERIRKPWLYRTILRLMLRTTMTTWSATSEILGW